MTLIPILELAVPALAKAILKSYLGAEMAAAAGSALTIAIRHFSSTTDAKKAEAAAKSIARSILVDIQPWLVKEIPRGDDQEFYVEELIDTIERGFCERNAVLAALDSERLADILIAFKRPDWTGNGPSTIELLSSLVRRLCVPLARLVPTLPEYAYERDAILLTGMEDISKSVSEILAGQRAANDLIQDLRPEPQRARQNYEDRYRSALTKQLDYVEILGLDLKHEDRMAKLSVAYLSLTVDEGSATDDEERALQFEDVLALLPLHGNRLIIEGGAGSGKSTLLRWATIQAASHGTFFDSSTRQQKSIADAFEAVKTTAKGLKGLTSTLLDIVGVSTALTIAATESNDTDSNRLAGFSLEHVASQLAASLASASDRSSSNDLIPFLVRLRDLQAGAFPDIDGLARTIVDVGTPPEGWVADILSSGRGIVLVDGVDELSEERGARGTVLAAFRRLAKTFPKNAFIIAGRPGAFTSSPFDADTKAVKVTVNDMDDVQRRVFIDRWHAAKAERQTEVEARSRILGNSSKLAVELEQNSALRRMASNPLLAASICALHDRSPSTVPKNEYELCERLAKMLVSERDMTEDEGGHKVNVAELGHAYALDYGDKRTVISRIAGQMLQTGDSLLSWKECKAVVAATLPSLSRATRVTADALLVALAIRSGVLRRALIKSAQDASVGPDASETDEAIEFVHNRFKEWFASISYRDRGQPTELANRLPDDPFDQIAIFAVSADGSESFANDLVDSLRQRVAKEGSSTRRRAMKLTAVRLSEAARLLDPELRTWATSMHAQLFPPSSKTEARALSLLGDTAVPFLKWNEDWSAKQAALAAYCLRLIGTTLSETALEDYLSDDRWTVAQEFVGEATLFRSAAVRKRLATGSRLSGASAQSLRSLANLPNLGSLTKLNLSYTSFSDTASLVGASKVRELNLTGTPIAEVSPLANLKSLRRLQLNHVKISDFTALSSLSLHTLSLNSTLITNGSLLGTQPELIWLSLNHTPIGDVSHIARLPKLRTLVLQFAEVSDYTPLAEAVGLTELYLDGAKGIDLGILQNIPNLATLSLTGASISGFWESGRLEKLTVLALQGSSVQDLSFLNENRYVQSLNLDNATHLSSLSGIEGLKNLKRIDLDFAGVEDIGALARLSNLSVVFSRYNKVRDYSPLLENESLRQLFVSDESALDTSAFRSKGVRVNGL